MTVSLQQQIEQRKAELEQLSQAAPRSITPSAPDLVTIASYGLGLWWCLGGPTWAAVASIVGDEVDGRLARATGTTSERGAYLDWGTDMTLIPLSLLRLGKEIDRPVIIVLAPVLLYGSAHWKANGMFGMQKPVVGSARAVIMLATILVEQARKRGWGV